MYAGAYNNMGTALIEKGQLDAAILSCKKAIELDPKLAVAHHNLGNALKGKGQLNAAIASFSKTIELDPMYAPAHHGLGFALEAKGELDAAIASYKTAIKLDPKLEVSHRNLGIVLRQKGQTDAAIASLKKAIELDPKNANSHHSLGHALEENGHFDAAVASFKKAIELDSNLAHVRTDLAKAQRLAAAQEKLPAFLKGDFKPTTSDERLGLIDLCMIKNLYRTSAGLFADAFAADAKLADDLDFHRYNAACCAALAAAGQGKDAAKLDEPEKARLRKQALDWLRAELVKWTEIIDSGSAADRSAVLVQLKHLPEDSDLAGIRDAAGAQETSGRGARCMRETLERCGVPLQEKRGETEIAIPLAAQGSTGSWRKKSFPLSSISTNAGKSTTSILKMASIPSSAYFESSSTFFDVLLGQKRGRPSDRAEIEAAVLPARVRHGLRSISLGDHDQ